MKLYKNGERALNGWVNKTTGEYSSDLFIGMDKVSGYYSKLTDYRGDWNISTLNTILGVKVTLNECSDFLNDDCEPDDNTFEQIASLMEDKYVLYARFTDNGDYYVWTIDL